MNRAVRIWIAVVLCGYWVVIPAAWAEHADVDYDVTETRAISLWQTEYLASSSADPETNRQATDDLLDELEEAGLNTATAITWWRRAFWDTDDFATDSSITEDYDPIGYFIAEAQARGMEVHAWFVNARPSTTYQPHIYEDHPEWFARNPQGERHDKRLDYAHPKVRQREHDIMIDFLETHPNVDAIQFDYIRYMFSGDWYYSDAVRDGFEEKTGIDPLDMYHNSDDYSDQDHQDFQEFLEAQPTKLVRKVYESAKEINPDVQVGAAVLGASSWAEDAKQPWPQWVEDDELDFFKTMWYDLDPNNYFDWHGDWWLDVADDKRDRFVFPIGLNQEVLDTDPDATFPVVERIRERGGAGHFYFRWGDEHMPDDWGQRARDEVYQRDARPYSHALYNENPDDPTARILVLTSPDRVTRLFGLRNLFREHGFAVDVTAGYAGEQVPEELEEDYDLVWFSREAIGGDYDEPGWAKLDVPTVVATPFIADTWGWAEDSITGDADTAFEVADADHPIVAGEFGDGEPLVDEAGQQFEWRKRELSLCSVFSVAGGRLLLTQGDGDVAPALAVWEAGELDDTQKRRAFLNINFESYLDWKNDGNDRETYATNMDELTDAGVEVVLRTAAWVLDDSDESDDNGGESGDDADAGGELEPGAGDSGDIGVEDDAGNGDGPAADEPEAEPTGCDCSTTGGGAPFVAAVALIGLLGINIRRRDRSANSAKA